MREYSPVFPLSEVKIFFCFLSSTDRQQGHGDQYAASRAVSRRHEYGDKYEGRYDYEEVDTIMITGMAKKNGTARAKSK